MKKLTILAAGAVGYVLGAKAGRERYEQISRQAQKLRNNPTVQQKVGEARHAAKDAAGTAAQKVREHRSDSNGDTFAGPASSSSMTSPTGSPPGSGGVPGGPGGTLGRGDEGV